ncbi:MAG: hypothetical protein JSV32_01110 [Dehalococcoidia bacterium]|nr:MAG: hypothetical protein JSV32_01110 [Dehalococcoidia bacterium]
MRKLVRLSIAIGGFLIVTSLVLTGIVFLILFNLIDISAFTDPKNTLLLGLVFLTIGALDFLSGMIILKKR